MAIYGAFTHCGLFVGGYDLTGLTNMVRLDAIKEVKDRTVFGNIARVRAAAGLADLQVNAAGFIDVSTAAGQDQAFRTNWGADDISVTFMLPLTSGVAPAVGDYAYFLKGSQAQYIVGDQQGNDLMWSLQLQGGELGYPLCMGRVLNPGTTAITADANGTGYQVGAVAAGQKAYAIMHTVEVSAGDVIDVIIESDDNAGFTSATTRFTFTQAAAVGAEFLAPVSGPITDDYWRAVYNVTGAAVSIKCAIALAIL